jgi:hypothetical protein
VSSDDARKQVQISEHILAPDTLIGDLLLSFCLHNHETVVGRLSISPLSRPVWSSARARIAPYWIACKHDDHPPRPHK